MAFTDVLTRRTMRGHDAQLDSAAGDALVYIFLMPASKSIRAQKLKLTQPIDPKARY